MDKQWKKRLNSILVVFIIVVVLLPNFSIFFSDVYGVTAGTVFNIPTSFEQIGSQYEKEDISWASGTGQEAVNKIWVSQGKPADNNNWSYITVGGQKRYLVALAQTYGLSGDYVDITLKTGKTYPCVIGDSKRLHEPDYPDNTDQGAFYYKGVTYGHCYGGKCSIVELMLKDYSKTPSSDFLNSMKPVTKIVNGGSCLNGQAPTGLDATYVTVGVSVGSQDEWLKALEDITNEMIADGGWIYSNKQNKTSYLEAKKVSPKRTNCNLMVTHALQYFGAFESNMKFYGKDDGSISYANVKTRERMEEIAEIIDYEKGEMTTKKADLQPGDIVIYYGQHTNVYKGTDESGNKVWYDAGRSVTDTGSDNGKFLTFTKTTNDIGMNISHIIRLKYNTLITEEQQLEGDTDTEANTFAGAVGSFFRELWASIESLFDNLETGRNDTTVLYSFKNVDEGNNSLNSANLGNLPADYKALINEVIENWSSNVSDERKAVINAAISFYGQGYSQNDENGYGARHYAWNNIWTLEALDKIRYSDCSTFVGMCYYKAGITKSGFASYVISEGGGPPVYDSRFKATTVDNLIPGDIGATSSWGHTGLYIGKDDNGNLIWMDMSPSDDLSIYEPSQYQKERGRDYGGGIHVRTYNDFTSHMWTMPDI